MPENENVKLYIQSAIDPPKVVAPAADPYAELDVVTNFSFLRGASHPDELVFTAALLGYRAMGVTDINTLAGVVRAYDAAKKVDGFKLVVGARLVFADGSPDLLVWPTDRQAYARLSRLLTLGRRRAPKGECRLALNDFLDHSEGLHTALAPAWPWNNTSLCHRLREALGDRLSLAVSLSLGDDDASRLASVQQLGRTTRIPLLATNHVHYHEPGRRPLQDVLTCVRHGCVVQEAGYRLFPNAERYLKTPRQMTRLFARCPQAIERNVQVAAQCKFDLSELKYDYPTEVVPIGRSPADYLRDETYRGAAERYPEGIPPGVRVLLEKELGFICHSKYESYFLTVYDLVRYARSRGILCQGRGSAANSAVCYCLGVTAVDPARFQLVFERFASGSRNEPPDIDIDFEHERREEVIQYVYQKYGRERAGMTASLITYRGRSAVRDVGKALGFSQDTLDQLAGKLDWWHRGTVSADQLREAGIDPADPTILQLIAVTSELLGFPRHLSQHVGGMVISQQPLCDIVPIENAAMVDRTVIEWDKDDLDTLGIFKVDILALGMLTAISKSLAMINAGMPNDEIRVTNDETKAGNRHSSFVIRTSSLPFPIEMHTLPQEEPAVYDMISNADTVGVFQVESRAQMSMLPRLRPREFYDLVIEVAIVRPGPIQGDMVHPYLQRREARRIDPNYEVEYPKPELKDVLHKTLGVPLFQEQAMRLAMVAAGFDGAEADALRRAMAAWKRTNAIEKFRDKFIGGMIGRGYEPDFAERCFKQISGFGEYGFPESHAASFAKLVYVSAWIKRFHPAAFAAGLLNSQPMGFYAPAQLVRDAREHDVEIRPVDVNFSDWDCTLEEAIAERRTMNDEREDARRFEASRRSPSPGTPGEGRGEGQAANAERRTVNDERRTMNDERDDARSSAFTVHRSKFRTHPNWGHGGPAVRLGFRMVKGLREEDARRIVAARVNGGAFRSLEHLQHAAGVYGAVLHRLARADAFGSLRLTRRPSTWEAMGLSNEELPLFDARATGAAGPDIDRPDIDQPDVDGDQSPPVALPPMPANEEVIADYNVIGLSLKQHPVTFARDVLNRWKVTPAGDLLDPAKCPDGRVVSVAGLVLVRQRPGTASGVVFTTLEDETGIANLIIWPKVYDRYHRAARHSTMMQVNGTVQRQGQVIHVIAAKLIDRTDLLYGLSQKSRNFH